MRKSPSIETGSAKAADVQTTVDSIIHSDTSMRLQMNELRSENQRMHKALETGLNRLETLLEMLTSNDLQRSHTLSQIELRLRAIETRLSRGDEYAANELHENNGSNRRARHVSKLPINEDKMFPLTAQKQQNCHATELVFVAPSPVPTLFDESCGAQDEISVSPRGARAAPRSNTDRWRRYQGNFSPPFSQHATPPPRTHTFPSNSDPPGEPPPRSSPNEIELRLSDLQIEPRLSALTAADPAPPSSPTAAHRRPPDADPAAKRLALITTVLNNMRAGSPAPSDASADDGADPQRPSDEPDWVLDTGFDPRTQARFARAFFSRAFFSRALFARAFAATGPPDGSGAARSRCAAGTG